MFKELRRSSDARPWSHDASPRRGEVRLQKLRATWRSHRVRALMLVVRKEPHAILKLESSHDPTTEAFGGHMPWQAESNSRLVRASRRTV